MPVAEKLKVSSIQNIKQELERIKTTLEQNKAKLDQLYIKRARLRLLHRSIPESLEDETRAVMSDVEDGPYQINILEQDLVAEQAKIAADTSVSLLEQQKAAASDVELLSKSLVQALGEAMAINSKLDVAYREYCSLKEQTGESCITQGITRPSENMLKFLYEICSQELQGKIVQRQLVSVAI